MYIPKGTKVDVEAHHGEFAVGILAVDYERGGDVDLREFISPISANIVKSVTLASD